MKKNDYLLLVATGAYSFLFYQQNAGINFLLFTIILLTVIAIKNRTVLKNKKWLWCALLALISATNVFINSSTLSIIANVVSLLVVSAMSFNTKTSGLFSLVFSCFSVVSSSIYMVIDTVNRIQAKQSESTKKNGTKLLATIIAVFVSILFFNLYKSSNPLFADNTKWINLDFISVSWIFFTLGGLLVVYGLFYHRTITPLEGWENNLSLQNRELPEDAGQNKQYETEHYTGLLLFVLLNIMLVVLNIGDIQTLYFGGGLPKGVSHSDFVRHGVGLIILSILIATGLMMYLFRKEFTQIKYHKWLVVFSYIWIAQNLIMLVSTAFRNQLYIHYYNLTYKRIGVDVWLLLAAIGLLVLFLKIYQKRSNWYLVRRNVAVWFSVLVMSSCVNWDKLITQYNISNKPLEQVDFYYLLSLSNNNIPELIAVTKRNDFKAIQGQPMNISSVYAYRLGYSEQDYTVLLIEKIQNYLDDRISGWKSYDLSDQEVYNSIYSKK